MKTFVIGAFAFLALVSTLGDATPASAGPRCGFHRHFVRGHYVIGPHGHRHYVPGHCV